MAFANWLQECSGLFFSLSSEAQWEYFARAGTTSLYWTGKKLPFGFAACLDCAEDRTFDKPVPVGSFLPNAWGIYDTAGNVTEWTQDAYHDNYEGAPTDGSAWENPGEKRRIQRGGSFSAYATDLTSAMRDWQEKTARTRDYGFRLVINEPSPVIR